MRAKTYPKQKVFKGFANIGPILQNTAKEYKLELALYKYKAEKNWEKILGSFLGNCEGKSRVVGLKNGVLNVACLCKDLAYEIKVLASRIIYALNKFLGRQVVCAIAVEV